ncbi:replication protein [Chromobacterium haemolyticum]|uniref:replication protein n=1 Tax=Chromobacterium haemolyticum TaxID=394935 RepID=UPI002447D5DD|nr:replication protein [Chromobacterium haemolyticum]MDH0342853.1 replication protein [Chromobacterium haemolyticum]
MSAAEKVINLAARRAEVAVVETDRQQGGFVAIPNELMDALLSADLTARQLKLALAVVRKTLGYGKEEDDCTITQLADVAGLQRSNASVAFQQLLDMNIISARKGRHGSLVSVNPPAGWTLEAYQNNTKADTSVSNQYAGAYQNDTHNKQLQNTTTFPPVSPLGDQAAEPAKPARKPRAKGVKRTFAQWRDETKAAGAPLIPEDDEVFTYAEEAGIERDFLRLAWIEFRTVYTGKSKSKQYIDWRAHFRDAVRRNWYKLWFLKADGSCELTTAGLQASNAAKAADRKGAN